MDYQEVLNTSYAGIISQGCPSISQYGCAYRGRDGAKCAIGWLIPDEEYDPSMDLPNGEMQISHSSVIKNIIGAKEDDIEFLDRLQLAHDRCFPYKGEEFIEMFNSKIKELCSIYNLKFPGE